MKNIKTNIISSHIKNNLYLPKIINYSKPRHYKSKHIKILTNSQRLCIIKLEKNTIDNETITKKLKPNSSEKN